MTAPCPLRSPPERGEPVGLHLFADWGLASIFTPPKGLTPLGGSGEFEPELASIPPRDRGAWLEEPGGDEERVVSPTGQFHHHLPLGHPEMGGALEEAAPDLAGLGPLAAPE